jgi:hypothetical protein
MRIVAVAFGLGVAASLGGCFVGPAPDVVDPAAPAQPALTLSPSSLSFAGPTGGADPAPQTISAWDGGAGTLAAPTTQITYHAASGWLSATVSGTAPPYTIAVQPHIASLPPGTYSAAIDVDSPGASGSPQTVAVALDVGSASQATMVVSPSALAFSWLGGATPPPPQVVSVSNAGAGTLAPPAATTTYQGAAKDWLSVTVSGAAAPYTVTVQPLVPTLPQRPGVNLATISLDCAGASNTPQIVTVQLTVR